MKRKLKKSYVLLLVFILGMSTAIFGCTSKTESNPVSESSEASQVEETAQSIVASTSWTAYMAKAAGADEVSVIAPIELKHPPEYDFKPSDVELVKNADWIIMAGYEPFMKKIIESNDVDESKIIIVKTMNTYSNLTEQTKIIAEKLGTLSEQSAWQENFKKEYDSIAKSAEEKNVSEKTALVHVHLSALAESLGYNVVGVFGAEEMSPAKIAEFAELKPDIIIDNFHNPQGEPIKELCDAELVTLRNFPGPEDKDLIDLFKHNAQKMGL